jgi:hypothetical protein
MWRVRAVSGWRLQFSCSPPQYGYFGGICTIGGILKRVQLVDRKRKKSEPKAAVFVANKSIGTAF